MKRLSTSTSAEEGTFRSFKHHANGRSQKHVTFANHHTVINEDAAGIQEADATVWVRVSRPVVTEDGSSCAKEAGQDSHGLGQRFTTTAGKPVEQTSQQQQQCVSGTVLCAASAAKPASRRLAGLRMGSNGLFSTAPTAQWTGVLKTAGANSTPTSCPPLHSPFPLPCASDAVASMSCETGTVHSCNSSAGSAPATRPRSNRSLNLAELCECVQRHDVTIPGAQFMLPSPAAAKARTQPFRTLASLRGVPKCDVNHVQVAELLPYITTLIQHWQDKLDNKPSTTRKNVKMLAWLLSLPKVQDQMEGKQQFEAIQQLLSAADAVATAAEDAAPAHLLSARLLYTAAGPNHAAQRHELSLQPLHASTAHLPPNANGQFLCPAAAQLPAAPSCTTNSTSNSPSSAACPAGATGISCQQEQQDGQQDNKQQMQMQMQMHSQPLARAAPAVAATNPQLLLAAAAAAHARSPQTTATACTNTHTTTTPAHQLAHEQALSNMCDSTSKVGQAQQAEQYRALPLPPSQLLQQRLQQMRVLVAQQSKQAMS